MIMCCVSLLYSEQNGPVRRGRKLGWRGFVGGRRPPVRRGNGSRELVEVAHVSPAALLDPRGLRPHDCLRTGTGVTSTGSTKRRRRRQERRAKEDLRERAARARRAAPASLLSPRRPAPAPARMRGSAHSSVRAAAGSRAPAYTTCTHACEPRRPLSHIRECTA